MDATDKLKILADDSRYDLACANCSTKDEHRTRTLEGTWLYPVSLPNGGKSVLLKTLMSNVCQNDCRYCPLRDGRDVRRCTLGPEEVVNVFMDYVLAGKVAGLFLSSGVVRDADTTMDRLVAVGRILRQKYRYRGFIHLKAIPGASDAAIEAMLAVANTVSVNVEVPKASAMQVLSARKDYQRDIVRTVQRVSELTARGNRYEGVKQSTQFIVGAAGESDRDIVRATYGLYKRLHLNRVYYSAYQKKDPNVTLPGDATWADRPHDLLTREHRLYQTDFLIRQYGFDDMEIPYESDGNLSLTTDPKEHWAQCHPEFFPLDVNHASRRDLLRVPGLGPISVRQIMNLRRNGGKVWSLRSIGTVGIRLQKAAGYLKFGY